MTTMEQILCDRCGKVIDFASRSFFEDFEFDDEKDTRIKLDLCESCEKELKKWLKSK